MIEQLIEQYGVFFGLSLFIFLQVLGVIGLWVRQEMMKKEHDNEILRERQELQTRRDEQDTNLRQWAQEQMQRLTDENRDLQGKVVALTERVAELTGENKGLNTRLESLANETEKLRLDLQDYRTENQQLIAENQAINRQKARIENENRQLKQKSDAQLRQINDLVNKNTRLQKEVDQLNFDLSERDGTIITLQNQIRRITNDGTTDITSSANEAIAEVDAEETTSTEDDDTEASDPAA